MTACASPVAEAPAPMAEKARCGKAALTVWGVQSPLVAGQRFSACLRAKSLDGLPLGDARAVVLNGDGAVVGAVRLAGEKAGGLGGEADVHDAPAGARVGADAGAVLVAEGVIELGAPAVAGPASWRVALEVDGARLAVRPLAFSVTPALVRPVRLRVIDAATGEPLSDASCYLYHRNLAKVRPIHAVSDSEGWADALVAEGAPYNVRIECRGYREGVCSLDAGDAMTPAESVARLVADVRDELDSLAARRGPAGY